jgi:hypothetical protein
VIRYRLIFFLLLITSPAWAQQQQQEEDAYKREFNYGINFNTNAGLIGGGVLKSSRYLSENWSKFLALEVVEVKHPKENRLFSVTGSSFIAGKSNYLYVMRPQYGREYIFFRKAPESGVQVNGIFAVGPSFGLLVPYYIVYDYAVSGGPNNDRDLRTEPYDPDKHKSFEKIHGNAGFFTGFGHMDVNLGAHLKTGLSFEYGRYREDVTGVEVGFLMEAYPKELLIISGARNTGFFTSAYLTLYYGRRK